MTSAFRVARIAGIDIRVHPSWLVVFFLVTWSLAGAYFPEAVPDATTTTHWLLGVVAALLLFGSVVVHELAHSLVARARGLGVNSITLFLFGGVSNLAGESPRPGVEFLIAIVGPLSSFAIAALALLGAGLAPQGTAVEAVLGYLGIVNLLLGGFNLIPGFPLDGGRVLRSIAWRATGSLRRATEIAAAVGSLVAYGFFVWGFLRVLNGDLLGGIWIAAIGWFLQSAAGSSVEQVRLETTLRRTRVGTILQPDDRSVPPDLDVARLVEEHLLPQNRRSVPVTSNGRVVGMATLGDVRAVPPDARRTTRVADVMGGRDGVATLRPDDSLADALATLARGDWEQAPVVEDGRLIGVLTRADVVRQFQLREALGVDGESGAGRSTGEVRPSGEAPASSSATVAGTGDSR